ncbi:hypothetical protein ACFFSW_37085 [Saccharothrix longispora]|uniref:Uncharacterized protein n=1 Tax=Saccharothrix longispora TaxID=33920 RepID=A0ABU1PPR8_9PSEU|nr:hypothetical protein [Saccharothrix longispora]MDR6592666.1 hypothetical protein [Saccharothrix longispora]
MFVLTRFRGADEAGGAVAALALVGQFVDEVDELVADDAPRPQQRGLRRRG